MTCPGPLSSIRLATAAADRPPERPTVKVYPPETGWESAETTWKVAV